MAHVGVGDRLFVDDAAAVLEVVLRYDLQRCPDDVGIVLGEVKLLVGRQSQLCSKIGECGLTSVGFVGVGKVNDRDGEQGRRVRR